MRLVLRPLLEPHGFTGFASACLRKPIAGLKQSMNKGGVLSTPSELTLGEGRGITHLAQTGKNPKLSAVAYIHIYTIHTCMFVLRWVCQDMIHL